jgi:imidazole glycerol phosphate synthase glutamine amidotransferase subunit
MTDVTIVPTGTANLASVRAAFDRLGAGVTLADTPEAVEAAPRVVVPGVGSFGAAMDTLVGNGTAGAIERRVASDRPTLAVCVGMQLLANCSEESDGIAGLGVLDQRVRRFGEGVRLPQLGWNHVTPSDSSRFLTRGWAYFANSYRIEKVPDGWSASFADHGGSFVAALERGAVLACQFHPELSGAWGGEILARWLSATEGVG